MTLFCLPIHFSEICRADPYLPEQAAQHADQLLHAPPASNKGFSSNPFALTHRDPPETPKPTVLYRGDQKEVLPHGNTGAPDDNAAGPEAPLSVARPKTVPDRLHPKRNTFSGGEHTLSRLEEKPAPEMSMNYKLNDTTSTSVTLNPQDSASPLHRPAGQEPGLNAAGVYMNVEVQPDLRMKVGGEYGEIESRYSPREETAKGASVGLEWSF